MEKTIAKMKTQAPNTTSCVSSQKPAKDVAFGVAEARRKAVESVNADAAAVAKTWAKYGELCEAEDEAKQKRVAFREKFESDIVLRKRWRNVRDFFVTKKKDEYVTGLDGKTRYFMLRDWVAGELGVCYEYMRRLDPRFSTLKKTVERTDSTQQLTRPLKKEDGTAIPPGVYGPGDAVRDTKSFLERTVRPMSDEEKAIVYRSLAQEIEDRLGIDRTGANSRLELENLILVVVQHQAEVPKPVLKAALAAQSRLPKEAA